MRIVGVLIQLQFEELATGAHDVHVLLSTLLKGTLHSLNFGAI